MAGPVFRQPWQALEITVNKDLIDGGFLGNGIHPQTLHTVPQENPLERGNDLVFSYLTVALVVLRFEFGNVCHKLLCLSQRHCKTPAQCNKQRDCSCH